MNFSVIDALGTKISLSKPPDKIISLVPSVTYSLDYFGVGSQVIGITRFCKFPADWQKTKTIVGGTKDVKIDRIKTLQPDLIIANKEENTKETVEKLRKIAPVYVSDVYDMASNHRFIKDLGSLLQKEHIADKLIKGITLKLAGLQKTNQSYRTVYMIWREPWMTVGGGTFIHRMMHQAGFINLLGRKKRYPITDIEALKRLNPDIVLLSSEPFPFKEKHKIALQQHLPNTKIMLVKGEAFTWFGAYPLIGLEYLLTLKRKLG